MTDNTTELSGVKAISAGDFYTAVLKDDGTVWAGGSNYYGQLGDGTTENRSNPVQVQYADGTPLSGVKAISARYYHTVALKDDGTVWAWGRNNYGQLGISMKDDTNNPVQVLLDSYTIFSGIVSVSIGNDHTVALDMNGTVWAWGHNMFGQLGDGTTTNSNVPVQVMIDDTTELSGVKAISSGDFYTVALKDGGIVWAWGFNGWGQLGDGTAVDKSNPVQVMTDNTTELSGVKAISAGSNHTVVLKDGGIVWAWGSNNYGQLGNGTDGKAIRYPVVTTALRDFCLSTPRSPFQVLPYQVMVVILSRSVRHFR